MKKSIVRSSGAAGGQQMDSNKTDLESARAGNKKSHLKDYHSIVGNIIEFICTDVLNVFFVFFIFIFQ